MVVHGFVTGDNQNNVLSISRILNLRENLRNFRISEMLENFIKLFKYYHNFNSPVLQILTFVYNQYRKLFVIYRTFKNL